MKRYCLILLVIPLLILINSINSVSAEISNACSLQVTLVNQDPYPAIPNDYVDIVFQVSGVQNSECGGARFELIQSYPFSLDKNDSSRVLPGATYLLGSKNDWMIPYKVRVDKDALDGNATIEARYAQGKWGNDSYISQKFDIEIKDSRTTFDAVIQDTSGSEVSIAIANTGKYTANSVVVRIPEQDNFRITGTNGQMVGNLISGDYTIVGFSVTPSITPTKGTAFQNISRREQANFSSFSNNLKFDVYYTDNMGERRIVNMELPLNLAGNFSLQNGNFARRSTGSTSSSLLSKWYVWVILAVVVLILFGFYNKYKKKINKIFDSHSHKEGTDKSPDWVRNAKDKEKNK